jgi:hypothetical protein
VITTGNRTTIYVSGDTIPFAGTDEIASRYAPLDLAILNLGCARIDALGDLKVSLSADEAIRYAQALGLGAGRDQHRLRHDRPRA